MHDTMGHQCDGGKSTLAEWLVPEILSHCRHYHNCDSGVTVHTFNVLFLA